MNDDDAEATGGDDNPSNRPISPPEKTCAEPMDDDTSQKPSVLNVSSQSNDLNKSNDSSIESSVHDRTDSSLNTTVNSRPSTSGKSKRKSGAKKHRAGRNRKRKWKPYNKLTWQEKQRLDERNARRAQRVRDEMSAVGFPLAPYNTSQFLIDDYLSCHVIKTPNYEDMANGHDSSEHSEESSDEHYHINSDMGAFYEQAFLEDYELVHEEYLNNLTQFELAEEWVDLEDKIEGIDKQLKFLQEQKKLLDNDSIPPLDNEVVDHKAELEKIEVFRVEIEKLKYENQDLETQNEEMRKLLNIDS